MKLKSISYVVAGMTIFLGLLHTVLTPQFYPGFTVRSLWFAGAGLGIIFLGLLNTARAKVPVPFINGLCLLANAIASVYMLLLVIKIQEAQAYISFVVVVLLLVISFFEVFPARVVSIIDTRR